MLNRYSSRSLIIVWLSMSALMITGCRGCRNEDQASDMAAEEKKEEDEEISLPGEKKKPIEKPPFETESAVIYPGQYSDVIRKNRAKPGHWVTADFRVMANQADSGGNLTATAYSTTAPVPVESTNYFAVSSRPFSIPKGELRNLETSVYIPRRERQPSININFDFNRDSGGSFSEIHGTPTLKAGQYHLVVLTNRPDAYGYLNVIDSVVLPTSSETGSSLPPFYTVVRTRPSQEPIALPRQSLCWTTIAYLIWDDLSVDQLDADQQQALVDWIHFGGQLILSGPDCLDRLGNSFLADYLPAKFKGAKNLTADDFAAINGHWSVPIANQPTRRRKISVTDKAPILGITFEPHPDAQVVSNTGQIAIERKIGRGRIVVTAFSMDDRPVVRWPGFRSFFNGCLLRRPGRQFGLAGNGTLTFAWTTDDTSIFDPLLGSTLRYLSRDLVNHDSSEWTAEFGTPQDPRIPEEDITGFLPTDGVGFRSSPGLIAASIDRPSFATNLPSRNLADAWHYGGYQHDEQSGTASWNDNSGVSAAARTTLKQAAGITPPSSGFVLRMLAVYLAVLVPVNWLIFRSIGRVEWAWIAAPFIALGGALMVARMASLDIGFVRSATQVSCIEIFADYPRAHVAQYTALYTSLSTGYNVDLDNPSAQMLPLGSPNQVWKEKTDSPVFIRQTIANRLEGLQVRSNTTGLLHSEMMFDMQGVFSLVDMDGRLQVDNGTTIDLTEAAMLRRTESGELQAAWLGDLSAGSQSSAINFESVQGVAQPWPNSSELMSSIVAERSWGALKQKLGIADSEDDVIPLSAVDEHLPEILNLSDAQIRAAVSSISSRNEDQSPDAEISFAKYKALIGELNPSNRVTVSRLFRAVTNNLEIAAGEMRLIACSNQPIGNSRFTPQSNRNQQQALVIVHLKRPALPPAIGDSNAVEDFFGNSNLDWLADEEEAQQLDAELETDRK